MFSTYHQSQLNEASKCGCCVMQTQHIFINLISTLDKDHSEYGLGYDVVMKLCQEITGKYHHVYLDNLFTSVPLMKDLLALNTYACGTVCKNKCGVPDAVKWPGKMR